MIRVEQEIPDQPEVRRLFAAADARSAALYPGEGRAGPSAEVLLEAGVRFFVARRVGAAVGCGGYVPGGPGWVEAVRVFVDDAERGQGIGGLVMSSIEALARAERFDSIRLETGSRATEAIRLYRRLGYSERAPYGPHAAEASSVFMEKGLGEVGQSG